MKLRRPKARKFYDAQSRFYSLEVRTLAPRIAEESEHCMVREIELLPTQVDSLIDWLQKWREFARQEREK